MRIDINLASRPYEDSGKFWSYWGTGLALLSLITAVLLFFAITGFVRAGHDRQQISKLETEIAAYDQEKGQAEALLNRPQNRQMREQSRFLNELFLRKAFSWTRVFEDLEQVMPAHLHVVSIHPDMSNENSLQLKLLVGGDSQNQALDLVRKMEGSKSFRETRIENVKYASEQTASTDKVQVQISALYNPSAKDLETSGGIQ